MALDYRAWMLFCPSLLACAAEGGQTGDENRGLDCARVGEQTLDFDALSPSGFSPDEIVSLVDGDHRAALTWLDEGAPSYGPEHGMSNISLGVSLHEGARATWIDLEPTESAINRAINCVDRLEIEVETAISTEGGALNELFTVTIVATQPDEAWLDVKVPVADLDGSLTVETSGESEVAVRVLAGFDSSGSTGALQLIVETRQQDAVAFHEVRIAAW
jgi:hypothetical protein